MNVVVLTSIFKPEPIVGAQTALSIAKEMASRGHKVTVVTSFPSRPAGKLNSCRMRMLTISSRRCVMLLVYHKTLRSASYKRSDMRKRFVQ